MTTVQIPLAIFDVICQFAYNTRCEKDLFCDVEFVADVQKSIPPVFFKHTLPARPFFEPFGASYEENFSFMSSRRRTAERRTYLELFTPNPYVRGNAYYPTKALDTNYGIWSHVPKLMVSLLKNPWVRSHKKYKGSLMKNVGCQLQAPISRWNYILMTHFSHGLWLDEKAYHSSNSYQKRLIPVWISALQSASFLSSGPS